MRERIQGGDRIARGTGIADSGIVGATPEPAEKMSGCGRNQNRFRDVVGPEAPVPGSIRYFGLQRADP
ncbi:hypothetical protein GWI34_06530 [Actinomadura sp. DSM 109109]|nr:hypothetical protein [Actinomadura lepetitiana]